MLQPNDDDRPSWLSFLLDEKQRAFDRLTPEQRAAATEAQGALRERAKARKAAAREQMGRIMRLIDSGHTAAEVGRAIGRRAISIVDFAKARGVFVSLSETTVGYRIPVTMERRATLRALAARHGVMTDVQVLETLVAFALDHEGLIAKFVTRNPDGVRAVLARAFTAGTPT